MNYQNIENETKKYSDFFKLSQNTLSKLSNYYKELGKHGTSFINKIKKALDEFHIEIFKEDRSTTYNKLLESFYNEKKNFFDKLKTFFTYIEKNFGDKLFEYEKDYKNKSKEMLLKLNNINKSISENKVQLDKWKNQYFSFCKNSIDIEKKIKSLKDNKEKEISKLNSQLTKNEELKDLKKKYYQEKQIEINKLLQSKETDYNNLMQKIEKENIDRMNNISNMFKEENKLSQTFLQDFTEHLNQIEKLKSNLNAKKDWNYLKNQFDFNVEETNNKEKRFIQEEFLDYDSMKNVADFYKINIDDCYLDNNNNTIIVNENDDKFIRAKSIYNIGKYFFVDFDTLEQQEKEINEIIINILYNYTMNNAEFLKVLQYIENDKINCAIFMDMLTTHFCKNPFIKIQNFENLSYLTNIIVYILNVAFDNTEIFDISFLAIYAAEKSGYLGKDKDSIPIFFFENISNKSVFTFESFWINLINAKINIISLLEINKEYNKRMQNASKKNKIFMKKDKIEGELMLKQIFKDKIGNYFTEAFYECLKHFTHFQFYMQEKLIKVYEEKYNIDKTTMDYFKSVIKSDKIFINLKNNYKSINSEEKLYYKKLFNYKPNKAFKKMENKSIKCILFSLKFLNNTDYINILCLSKKYYKPIRDTIYKQFLLKKEKLEIKNHILIWKILLNYKEIKEKHDYFKIVESIEDKNKIITNERIIQLDINRTHFSKNKEENQVKLSNILKAISSEFPKINYYQGMNRITAFLLNICDYNEEEAFYLFACIIEKTDYCSLYSNNLEKVNSLFYQFDHLLNLYIPELYVNFGQSSINAGYFLSSWFITLCTNFFNDSDEKNNAKSIMLIWDFFIFSKWKIFLRFALIILKLREKEILEKYSESLLHLLTGEILKSEIMDNNHFEQLREELLSNKFEIKTELSDSINEEFNIKKDIDFFKEGNKIYSAF